MLAALSARLNRCILINGVLLLTVFLGKNEKKKTVHLSTSGFVAIKIPG